MTQYLMLESTLQLTACLVKEFELLCGESIEVIAVSTDEMAENRPWYDGVLMFQLVYQLIHILCRVET